MRRNLLVATGIAAGAGALALLASPAIAQAGPWGPGATPSASTCATTCAAGDGTVGNGMTRGTGAMGNGMTRGTGTMGNGRGNGMGAGMAGQGGTTATTGVLTTDQKTALAAMAEEEKLAHDVYVALAAAYPTVVQFDRIARSETMHLTAIRTLLARYGIADPTVGQPAGSFTSARFQSLYDSLISGATSSSAALAAGVTIEKTDIADLTAALAGVTAPDVVQVLTNLRTASQHHLTAFGG